MASPIQPLPGLEKHDQCRRLAGVYKDFLTSDFSTPFSPRASLFLHRLLGSLRSSSAPVVRLEWLPPSYPPRLGRTRPVLLNLNRWLAYMRDRSHPSLPGMEDHPLSIVSKVAAYTSVRHKSGGEPDFFCLVPSPPFLLST